MIVLHSASLSAHILCQGATLAGLWLKGHPRSLVLGYSDPLSFAASPIYAGALVGPVANRVSRGRVVIAGTAYQMAQNEGENCLHSGDGGLHALIWSIVEQNASSVTLAVELPDLANGLPGARQVRATYALEDDTLCLTIVARSDDTTVMNIAHHPYWTLDETADVSAHRLQVNAKEYLPVDDQNLPLGPRVPVSGTDYDFRQPRRVSIDRTLDANLCISSTRSDTPNNVAHLIGRDGISLHIASTEPGLQVYNGSGLPMGGPDALPGQRIAPFAGIALEPQGWPDAPNHASFPSITLASGSEYRQITRYRIAQG